MICTSQDIFDLPHPQPWDRTTSNNSPPWCPKGRTCFRGCPGEMVTGQIEKCISGLVCFCMRYTAVHMICWLSWSVACTVHSFFSWTRWGKPRRSELALLFSARVVLNAPFNSRSVDLFNTLDWIPFYRESHIMRYALIHKRLKGNTPNCIWMNEWTSSYKF